MRCWNKSAKKRHSPWLCRTLAYCSPLSKMLTFRNKFNHGSTSSKPSFRGVWLEGEICNWKQNAAMSLHIFGDGRIELVRINCHCRILSIPQFKRDARSPVVFHVLSMRGLSDRTVYWDLPSYRSAPQHCAEPGQSFAHVQQVNPIPWRLGASSV